MLYVTNQDMNRSNDGVVKKIQMQMKAINNLGIEIDLWNHFMPGTRRVYKKILSRLPLFPINITWKNEKDLSDIDLLYIRKPNIDLWFIHFLKKIKGKYPLLTIVLEIPTFPYDEEYKDFKTYPYLLKERFWRRFLKYYVSKIVTYSEDHEIFGVKTICILNGIDLNEYEIRDYTATKHDFINLLGVANLSKWHGYDRVITGMAEYLKNEDQLPFRFHIIGDGKELLNLKKMVSNYNLNNYVFFYGKKHGAELNELYNIADIGVSSLAIHRIGISNVSSLKTREYLAKGLPIVVGNKDTVFKYKNAEMFCLPLLNSELAINCRELLEFHKIVYRDKNLPINIRKFAEKYLSWEVQMKKVIEGTVINE